jgi:hypothetical protein
MVVPRGLRVAWIANPVYTGGNAKAKAENLRSRLEGNGFYGVAVNFNGSTRIIDWENGQLIVIGYPTVGFGSEQDARNLITGAAIGAGFNLSSASIEFHTTTIPYNPSYPGGASATPSPYAVKQLLDDPNTKDALEGLVGHWSLWAAAGLLVFYIVTRD